MRTVDIIQRMRTVAGGHALEDIKEYNSVHELFSLFGVATTRAIIKPSCFQIMEKVSVGLDD